MTAVDFTGLAAATIGRGLRGLPIEEQLEAFCQDVYDAGFPMRRVSLGMRTLHPRYGALQYVWRQKDAAVEYSPRDRSEEMTAEFQNSPVRHMIETEQELLRARLDGSEPLQFPLLELLRDQGMTDYAARIVRFDPARQGESALEGVFFSTATDAPGGFDLAALMAVSELLPYLAMAVKSRLTYDVASNVTSTYLGQDAGGRVLTGEIERGSTQTIQAVIWLCDLRDFTAVSDAVPRDAVVALLNDYLDVMAGPVHGNGGQVLKFLGDGFLATFDATDETAAAVCDVALKAAGELRTAYGRFNEARAGAGRPTLDFGLSLTSATCFTATSGPTSGWILRWSGRR